MKRNKKIFLILLICFLFPFTARSEELSITGADSVLNLETNSASADVLDASDAPSQNIITSAFVSHEDSIFYAEFQKPSTNFKIVLKTPVLIIPGLMGTEMKKGDETLWPNLGKMFLNIGDDFMDPLMFKNNLVPLDNGLATGNIIKKLETAIGLINVDYTERLINEFKNQGYVKEASPDANLFTFPYDWRYGISGIFENGNTNIDLLKNKISGILEETGAEKVDIVAHSAGGLLAKKYVMENPSDNKIGKLVFVGTPNFGAPKAIKVLLSGDNSGIPFLADYELKKIAENLPISYDLLPSQEYYNKNGSYFRVERYSAFSQTAEDLDFPETQEYLKNIFNKQAVENSQNLRTSAFENYDVRTAGVKAYNIVGCKTATFKKLIDLQYGNQPNIYISDGYITGDGTVPFESAKSIPANNQNKFYAVKIEHGKLLSGEGTRQKIVNIISGSSLNTGKNVLTQTELEANPKKCELKGHWWQIFSPVSIEVINQDGNRSGIAEDGSIQNNIPGADYQVISNHKSVFVPTDEDQTYTVNLKGEGNGVFTFKDSEINDGQFGETQIFSNIPVSENFTGQVLLDLAGTTIAMDENGDGTFDKTLAPTSILSEEQSHDLIPPATTSSFDVSPNSDGIYKSFVKITLTSQDRVITGNESQTSGIDKIFYKLNNGDWKNENNSSVIVSVSENGNYNLSFYALDKAGNKEETQSVSFNIDTTLPPSTGGGGNSGGGGGGGALPVSQVIILPQTQTATLKTVLEIIATKDTIPDFTQNKQKNTAENYDKKSQNISGANQNFFEESDGLRQNLVIEKTGQNPQAQNESQIAPEAKIGTASVISAIKSPVFIAFTVLLVLAGIIAFAIKLL